MASLRKALGDVLNQPGVGARVAKLGMVPEGLRDDEAAHRIGTQGERCARIIKSTGMKIE